MQEQAMSMIIEIRAQKPLAKVLQPDSEDRWLLGDAVEYVEELHYQTGVLLKALQTRLDAVTPKDDRELVPIILSGETK